MSESRADEYRRKAEDCRHMAGRAKREDDKAAWLKMAEDWQRLAENAHGTTQRGSQPRTKSKP